MDEVGLMRRRLQWLHVADIICLCLLCISVLLLGWWIYQTPRAATFTMDTLPALLPRDGFYGWEEFSDRSGGYRWTDGSAEIRLPNLGGTKTIQMTMVGGPAGLTPVQVQAGAVRYSFVVKPELRVYSFLLPPNSEERQRLTINSSTARRHKRDLGVVVGDIRMTGGGVAPIWLLIAFVAATIGCYALVRQSGLRPWFALSVVVGLQLIVSLWQASGGWQYGLLGSVLFLVCGASLIAVAIERRWPYVAELDFSSAHLSSRDVGIIIVLLVVALCARLPWLIAHDPVGDLELSARRMGFLYTDGLAGAYRNSGDYMPLRLYLLYGLSKLVPLLGGTFYAPLPPATLILIKLPGLLADLATAALIYIWSRRWCGQWRSVTIAALYTLAPPVWINVAWWGQVDALLMLPLLATVVLLDRAGGRWSWLCWAVALLIKAQAIILAPLIYVVTLRRYGCRGLVRGVILAFGLLLIVCLPLILAGQGPGLAESYVGSVERFPRTTYGAYNLWYLALPGKSIPDTWQAIGPLNFRFIGLALLGSATVLICIALLRRSNAEVRANAAATLTLAFFLLPTQIHERYLFLSLAFVALCIASSQRLVLLYLMLVTTATLNVLGILKGFVPIVQAYMSSSPVTYGIAVINVLMLVILMGRLLIISGPSQPIRDDARRITGNVPQRYVKVRK